jgi:hypothetical protein
MQINMQNSGTFLFIGDHCHVMENVSSFHTISVHEYMSDTYIFLQWLDGVPQGFLARDHPSWFQSTLRLKRIEHITKGKIVPGHDEKVFLDLVKNGPMYT